MSLADFREYLEPKHNQDRWQYYPSGVFDNTHHAMYNVLQIATRDGASTLTFSQHEISLSHDDQVFHAFPMEGIWTSALQTLNTILQYDPIVQRYIHLSLKDEARTIYEIRA